MSDPIVSSAAGVDHDAIPTRLIVLGLTADDGTFVAADVHDVAEACDQSVDQVRSCLRRLVSEGLYERTGDGRDARYTATPAGRAELHAYLERARLAYHQDAAGRGWDRRWRLVAFAVPEAKRSARDAFRDHLRLLGGGTVQNGLYLSPHAWHDDVVEEADRLGVTVHLSLATTDDLEIAGERDPRALARQLWPLDEVARRWEDFVADHRGLPEALAELVDRKERLPDRAYLPGSLSMAMSFRRCFNRDPLLPPELLPRPWPGREARELVHRSYQLGLRLRERGGRPALFSHFLDVVEAL